MSSSLLMPTARSTAAARPLHPELAFPAVGLEDPAILVMTDFSHEHPVTVSDERRIDDALKDMIRFGVRALLVVRDERVVGLVTSYDIQGERPIQFLQSSTYRRHDELQVGHIMTPWESVRSLDWEKLRVASVREVLEVFQNTGGTHLVVSEALPDRTILVRGLISRARLERQLAHK
ncbi:MAG TPA: CBS domain-containing protein [Steroidobacteraceae bacterium]|nr:CBS domain-containing protein [Steroidobacteraceae bacterium]